MELRKSSVTPSDFFQWLRDTTTTTTTIIIIIIIISLAGSL